MRQHGSPEVIAEPNRAALLLHPLRRRLLELARTPASAADLARQLGLPPQRVNYHVRRLVEQGFLREHLERRARNLVAKVYVSTSEEYVLGSEVLGDLAPDPGFGIELDFRLESEDQAQVFQRALEEIVSAIVSKYTTSPESGRGEAYRLVLGWQARGY